MSDPDLPPPSDPELHDEEHPEAGRPELVHPELVHPEPGPVIDHAPESPPGPLPPPVRPAGREARIVRRGGTPVLLTLLLFAGLAGGLYWVWTNPQPHGSGDQQDQAALSALSGQMEAQKQAVAPLQGQLQDLSGQVQALGARVQKIEQAPTAPAAAPADNGDDAKRLDELSGKLDALAAKEQADLAGRPQDTSGAAPDRGALDAVAAQAKADAQGQVAALGQHVDQALGEQKTGLEQGISEEKAAVDALGGRIAKLEQGAGAVAGEADRTARALRLQQASVALAAGQPVGDITGAPPALAAFAHKAPPTEAALREDFPKVAEAARVASKPEGDAKGFLGRALARVQDSVTVRRGDHVIVGDPAAGVLARAQEDVSSGDLGGAAEALSALHGPPGDAVAEWVGQVRALLAARAALASMPAHG